MPSDLLQLLAQAERITAAQQQQLLARQQQQPQSSAEVILALGLFTAGELAEMISQLYCVPRVQIDQFDYPAVCKQLGQRELLQRHQALPLRLDDNSLLLAVADPGDSELEAEFRFASGRQIELRVAESDQLQAALRRLYGRALQSADNSVRDIHQDQLSDLVEISADELQESSNQYQDDSPVSRFINQVLLDAIRKGASDIHFEPFEHEYRIRLRCDGILLEAHQPPSQLSRRLAARLKILAQLDIAERRLPQDGRLKIQLNDTLSADMRVSTLPTLWGEKIVLRLLDSDSTPLDLSQLGFSAKQQKRYLHALNKPQGLILFTGPTGSGKTVSLYSGLRQLNTAAVNIATAEDPVEIRLNGVNQVQVSPQIGFGFAEALRAFLRQDPDVVMVGEIRDLETAEIAVKAAQTGHLVLSTLHTNSAADTIIRLANMGIARYNLAASLSLIIAQRLVRKLCDCKRPHPLNESLCKSLGLSPQSTIYQANTSGCPHCNQGYAGRTGLYEMMSLNQVLAESILSGASSQQIHTTAMQQGMQSLHQAGVEKLQQGLTSLAELQRVISL
ncbi:type IV-A pilus assembly ATPase PilB [Vibrio sp.]|uniref:type IV-A pilus assembly ATPase PilB n=1 Tax=Vibrio sp. TaxID=678 RepID=UPI003D147045